MAGYSPLQLPQSRVDLREIGTGHLSARKSLESRESDVNSSSLVNLQGVVSNVTFRLPAPTETLLGLSPSPRWRAARAPYPIGRSCLLDAEADAFRPGLRWGHELPDCPNQRANRLVVPHHTAIQLGQFLSHGRIHTSQLT